MPIDTMAENPLRRVDWKWQRASEILDGTGPKTTRRRDTPPGYAWICQAYSFQRSLEEATPSQQERLAQEMPDIFWAQALYRANNSMKDSIEAHILARESNFEIGFHCNLAPTTVEAYEQLFFHVRDKLQHRKYILHCVLGDAVHKGLSEREFGLLWKLYGYNLGPHVLSASSAPRSGAVPLTA
jgi:hypothetical protein